jgi:hypothetical protein
MTEQTILTNEITCVNFKTTEFKNNLIKVDVKLFYYTLLLTYCSRAFDVKISTSSATTLRQDDTMLEGGFVF